MLPALQFGNVPRLVCDQQNAGLEVAVDIVAFHSTTQQFNAVEGELPDFTRIVRAKLGDDTAVITAQPRVNLPPITA